jgi:hypothetical protein
LKDNLTFRYSLIFEFWWPLELCNERLATAKRKTRKTPPVIQLPEFFMALNLKKIVKPSTGIRHLISMKRAVPESL